MTAAWDRDRALRVAEQLGAVTEDDAYAEPWTLRCACRDAAALLRAADAEITRLRAQSAPIQTVADEREAMVAVIRRAFKGHGWLPADLPEDTADDLLAAGWTRKRKEAAEKMAGALRAALSEWEEPTWDALKVRDGAHAALAAWDASREGGPQSVAAMQAAASRRTHT